MRKSKEEEQKVNALKCDFCVCVCVCVTADHSFVLARQIKIFDEQFLQND